MIVLAQAIDEDVNAEEEAVPDWRRDSGILQFFAVVLLVAGRVAGPRVHDARIAAICRYHGVDELWSADRDFGRFPDLNVVNPLPPAG